MQILDLGYGSRGSENVIIVPLKWYSKLDCIHLYCLWGNKSVVAEHTHSKNLDVTFILWMLRTSFYSYCLFFWLEAADSLGKRRDIVSFLFAYLVSTQYVRTSRECFHARGLNIYQLFKGCSCVCSEITDVYSVCWWYEDIRTSYSTKKVSFHYHFTSQVTSWNIVRGIICHTIDCWKKIKTKSIRQHYARRILLEYDDGWMRDVTPPRNWCGVVYVAQCVDRPRSSLFSFNWFSGGRKTRTWTLEWTLQCSRDLQIFVLCRFLY